MGQKIGYCTREKDNTEQIYRMIVILILAIVVAYLFMKTTKSKYRYLASPGPCLPVIGHSYKFANITKDPVNGMLNIYKKYNKNGILYVNTFNMDCVWVGDFEKIKFILNQPEATGRMTPNMAKFALPTRKVSGNEMPGILMSDGHLWVQQRRFTLRTLRDFGFGKQGMEEIILEEVGQFKSLIDDNIGQPFDFHNKLNLPILNALWKVTVGERFEYDNPRLVNLVERMTETFKIFANPAQALLMSYPWMEKILPESVFKWQYAKKVLEDISDMMLENIVKHQESLDVNSPRDFIDMMLIEIENTTDETSSFYGQLGIDNLKVTLFDLFLAGSETTSTTLTWAALYMVRYPHVQEKVQQELDRVVGTNRLPSTSDRPNLPYTEAVLMEIQRHGNIAPMGVQHYISKDLKVDGQVIPGGTMMIPLMTEVLKGDHWRDGQKFDPDRFLNADGQVKKDDHFIPFSTGKRQCLGETLAKTEFFLFFTSLVQQFRFLPEVEGQYPVEESLFGVTQLPKPFKARLQHRI